MTRTLALSAVSVAVGVVMGLVFASTRSDPMTTLSKCLEENKCVVTRYEYTPMTTDQQKAAPASQACPMYRLPIRQSMPLIGEVSNDVARHPDKSEDILLEFIDRTLQTDVDNNKALEESYSSYLKACGVDQDKTEIKAASFDSSKPISFRGSDIDKYPDGFLLPSEVPLGVAEANAQIVLASTPTEPSH